MTTAGTQITATSAATTAVKSSAAAGNTLPVQGVLTRVAGAFGYLYLVGFF
jgi:hypothetical protein